jgi:uncharacterized glyoxalase superfamily protein PhnB
LNALRPQEDDLLLEDVMNRNSSFNPILFVNSIEETMSYYVKGLGFLAGKGMSGKEGRIAWASVHLGDVSIMLGSIDAYLADPLNKGKLFRDSLEKNRRSLGVGVSFFVNLGGSVDIDAYYRGLKERGIKTDSEPTTKWWGDRTFALTDLNGYDLTFAQTVAAFDESKAPK